MSEPPERTPRARLADAYRLRARVDAEIAALEAEVDFYRQLAGGRLRRETVKHGDESAYQRHVRKGIPFPEDTDGGDPCGCRVAHARYEARRAAAAKRRRLERQLSIFDAQNRVAS